MTRQDQPGNYSFQEHQNLDRGEEESPLSSPMSTLELEFRLPWSKDRKESKKDDHATLPFPSIRLVPSISHIPDKLLYVPPPEKERK